MVKIKDYIRKNSKKLAEFIDNSLRISLFFDDDPDGICGANLMSKYLEDSNKEIVNNFHFSKSESLFSDVFNNKILDTKTDLLIFIDFGIESFGFYEEYKKFVKENPNIKIMIIDHHQSDINYEISNNILEINAGKIQQKIIGEQYCSSKIIYDLLYDLKPNLMNNFSWICAIGIVGDHCQSTWSDFIREVISKTNIKYPEEDEIIYPTEDEDYYLTPFGRASNLIFFGISKGEDEILNIFFEVKKSKSIFELCSKLRKYDVIKQEVYDYIENYDYFMKELSNNSDKKVGGFNIFEVEVKSNNSIETILSNLIAEKDSNAIFLVYRETNDGFFHISARLQSRSINLGALFSKISTNYEGSKGGGHEASAGAIVPRTVFKEYLDTFYHELKIMGNE